LPKGFVLTLISTLPIAAMVGDVNIYMNDSDDVQIAEIEIMIAEHKRYLSYNTNHVTVTILDVFSAFALSAHIFTWL
jgi:hypothetical protein